MDRKERVNGGGSRGVIKTVFTATSTVAYLDPLRGNTMKKQYKKVSHKIARKVMAQILRRPLASQEYVHHVDGNPENNTPINLALVTAKEHNLIHRERGDLYRFTREDGFKGHKFKSRYTKEELLGEIRRVARICGNSGKRITKKDFDELSFTGHGVLDRKFGTWTKAKTLADI